jgi:plastocyanin
MSNNRAACTIAFPAGTYEDGRAVAGSARSRRNRVYLLLPLLVVPALLGACFSEHTAPTTGGEGVAVGDIFFSSNHNGTVNPAVDTVAAGTTLTWTWASTETLPHSVQSLGSPSFTSSTIQTGPGKSYQFTFATPGTYHYDCAVHGSAMTGTVLVR